MTISLTQISIPWFEASAELRAVRPRIADVFDNFYRSVPQEDQDCLQVAIVRYPYADKIIDAGHPYWPNETEVPHQYIVSAFLPFGVILEKFCEVHDFSVVAEALEEIPLALLGPGETMGAFELVDFLTEVPNPQTPDWNITAGATSIHIQPNLNTRQNKSLLERQLGESVDFPPSRDTHTLVGQLRVLEVFKRIRRSWTVKVLFFSRGWFDLTRRYQNSPAAAAVKGLLTEKAWKALARVRTQKPNRLGEYLHDAARGGANQISLAESAVSLLTCVDEILTNRRPCFAPAWEDDDLGPFGAVSSQIVEAVVKEKSWVLRPIYLSSESNGVGYMQLDHASPAILNGRSTMGTKDKVREIMNILRAAAQSSKRMHMKVQARLDLQSYIQLLPRILFQCPATKMSQATGQGSNYFKFTADAGVKPVLVTSQDFYAPHFMSIPRERCAFFRNSLRITATD